MIVNCENELASSSRIHVLWTLTSPVLFVALLTIHLVPLQPLYHSLLALLRQPSLACQHLVLLHVRTLTAVTEPVSSGQVSKASMQGCILTQKTIKRFLSSLVLPYKMSSPQGTKSKTSSNIGPLITYLFCARRS